MRRLLLGVLSSAAAVSASATPWHVMGPRAMGMGGAYTAIAQGPSAAYWNPAGLGQLYNTWGLEVPAGFRMEFTGAVLQGANDLNDLNKTCSGAGAAGDCQARIDTALSHLGQPNNGAMLDAGGGAQFKFKEFVGFVTPLTYIGVTPRIDMVHNQAGPGANSIADNTSKIVLNGGIFTEFGVGYGHEIKETGLVLGANLKGIVGKVGYASKNIVTDDPGSDFSNFTDNAKTTLQPGIDLGMLWDMRETWTKLPMRPRFAVVGRNINNPKFKQPDAAIAAGEADKYPIHGQVRAGFALSPLKFWNVAADLDLTDNLTPVAGMRSRMLCLGTEVNIFNSPKFNIPLRVGLQKNVSTKADSALAYTGGFGLNFLHVMFDVAGMVSSKSTTLQSEGGSEKIPNNFGASARFALLFGGEDKGTRNKPGK